MARDKKTNAMRILDQRNVRYRTHSYDKSDGKIDGLSVAQKIGIEPAHVFKTLVAQGASGAHLVFIVPVTGELDLKKAAKAAGEKKILMIPVKEIMKWTGYVRGGCSPIGMKKHYPTFIDESAAGLEAMIVSAGVIGRQVELTPPDLIGIVEGSYADLTG